MQFNPDIKQKEMIDSLSYHQLLDQLFGGPLIDSSEEVSFVKEAGIDPAIWKNFPIILQKQEKESLHSEHMVHLLQGRLLPPSVGAKLNESSLSQTAQLVDEEFHRAMQIYKKTLAEAYAKDGVTIQQIHSSRETSAVWLSVKALFNKQSPIQSEALYQRFLKQKGSLHRVLWLQEMDIKEKMRLEQALSAIGSRVKIVNATLEKQKSKNLVDRRLVSEKQDLEHLNAYLCFKIQPLINQPVVPLLSLPTSVSLSDIKLDAKIELPIPPRASDPIIPTSPSLGPSASLSASKEAVDSPVANNAAGLSFSSQPIPEKKNKNKEAIKWYQKAAEQGDTDAQCNLGFCYFNGLGVDQDKKEAIKWLLKAAEQGHATAQYRLGFCYKNGEGITQDYKEAIKWYQKAAEQGDTDAQCNLSFFYFNGKGITQDKKEAIKWYQKAAEQGHVTAQYNLGFCYFNGEGITQDKKEAIKWYQKAAEQGHATAQSRLGFSYKNGEGITQDYKEAIKWFLKAAEHGDADAQCNLGLCYFKGLGVDQDKKEAIKWYQKAAEKGHATAQYLLGFCYKNGEGITQDYKEAIKWFLKAAEHGGATAQCNLGFCYFNGEGITQDKKEAIKWFLKAAEQGDATAQYQLGFCYCNGLGVEQDKKEAIKWYQKAAEQGHSLAQKSLDNM